MNREVKDLIDSLIYEANKEHPSLCVCVVTFEGNKLNVQWTTSNVDHKESEKHNNEMFEWLKHWLHENMHKPHTVAG